MGNALHDIVTPLFHRLALQHTTMYCNTLQHTADALQRKRPTRHRDPPLQTHCEILQHTAITLHTHELHDIVTPLFHRLTLRHTATHCNILQTHCNTDALDIIVNEVTLQRWCPWDPFHMSSCCSVLQCVAVCCSVLQCVAVCHVTEMMSLRSISHEFVLQCVAVCCSVLHFVTLQRWCP